MEAQSERYRPGGWHQLDTPGGHGTRVLALKDGSKFACEFFTEYDPGNEKGLRSPIGDVAWIGRSRAPAPLLVFLWDAGLQSLAEHLGEC